MAENSKIEWTDATMNPWRGCTKVSAGCANCYAETLSGRNPKVLGVWGPNGTRVVAAESQWKEPLRWERLAREGRLPDGSPNPDGHRPRVFCASLADVFEGPETMPANAWAAVEQARYRLWATIFLTPHLDWLLLTKRPENIIGPNQHIWSPGSRANAVDWVQRMAGEDAARRYYAADWPLPNVWLGTSVENQAAADERIPHLLKAPARVRFLSCEPLLGAVDLTSYGVGTNQPWHDWLNGIVERPGLYRRPGEKVDWVIVGGESGPNARPMHPDWARSLRDQCQAAGVAFFMKQWGEFAPVHELRASEPGIAGKLWHNFDPDTAVCRVGKKDAGRLLDGRTWDELPTSADGAE